MERNKIYVENCLETMEKMQAGSVDMVLCSPPYDELRDYNGYDFPFERIAKALTATIVGGGVIVWVVGDQSKDGSESGTSFRQALYFMDICGLRLHDTMIYEKNGPSYPANEKSNRYSQIFEYMFVFSKGAPKTVNLLKDKKNRWAGHKSFGKTSYRNVAGELVDKTNERVVHDFSYRNNIWKFNNGAGYSTKDKIAYEHPAIFPEQLAADHILTWSNEGDLIYDPFGGSGTTAKVCHLLKRDWILSEISQEYADIATARIDQYINANTLF